MRFADWQMTRMQGKSRVKDNSKVFALSTWKNGSAISRVWRLEGEATGLVWDKLFKAWMSVGLPRREESPLDKRAWSSGERSRLQTGTWELSLYKEQVRPSI